MFRGKPRVEMYHFEEFSVYSPKQFHNDLSIEDKDVTFYIKVCTNSNRAFTCPFPHIDNTVGSEELSNKEIKKIIDFINNTPEAIVYTSEYCIENVDGRKLELYYGRLDNN